MLAGLVDEAGQRCGAALLGDAQRVRTEQRGDRVEFTAVADVAPVECGVQADGEVAALVPGEAVREDDDAAGQHQDVAVRLVALEEEVGQGLRVGQTGRCLQGHRVQQAARAVRVEGRVRLVGPAAGDRDQAGLGVQGLNRVVVARAVDGDGLLVGVVEAERAQGGQVQLGEALGPVGGDRRVRYGEGPASRAKSGRQEK